MQPLLDRFEQTVWDSQFPVCILGNLATRDYELCDLDDDPASAEAQQDFTRRGLCFLGAIAIREGRPVVALNAELDERALAALSKKYLAHIERQLNARAVAEAADRIANCAEWLQRLYALPDLRPEVN